MSHPGSPLAQLYDLLSATLAAELGAEYAAADPLLRPTRAEGCDYQSNACLSLAKRAQLSPRELAARIVDRLGSSALIERAEVAGGGFINLRLAGAALDAAAQAALVDPRLGVALTAAPRVTVIDYSAPNVAKEMHVGHLRSTVIGDALARVLGFEGHPVIRQNHLGDWGTQFGMLVQHMSEGGETAPADFTRLTVLYREAKEHFDADATFAERARARVVALQAGDAETLELWRGLVRQSLSHINDQYVRLEVTLTDSDVKGESFYNPDLPATTEALMATGVALSSDGATVIFSARHQSRDGSPVALVVRKTDGGFGYDATDMSALRHRIFDLGGQRLIYVTDARQAQHFDMVFEAGARMGWLTDTVVAEHVPFGMVLGDDGRPFKTRAGTTVPLSDLLDEAVQRAEAVAREKNPDLPAAEIRELGRAIGIGALKYADLVTGRQHDYRFSFERMLAFEGNTAPYLQYAHVRAAAVVRRGAAAGETPGPITVDVDAERALVRTALEFSVALEEVSRRLEPHRLCGYLYELASAYSGFYETCPVLKAESASVRASRLALCELTARTLELGLSLLGIRTVAVM